LKVKIIVEGDVGEMERVYIIRKEKWKLEDFHAELLWTRGNVKNP
jgi:hypothetical protein